MIHDAHGRRVLVLLGNGTLVRYAYDARTLRLRRLRAEHAVAGGPASAPVWTCDGPVLQDHTFRHDRTGRLLVLADRTPGCGVSPTPDELDRHFAYDTLGRLVRATGRETDVPPGRPWTDTPRSTDLTQARHCTETYEYDLVGSLLSLAHTTDAAAAGAYTRTYTVPAESNRLASLGSGNLTVAYTYDGCGNLLTEATNRFHEWDAVDRPATFRDQAGTARPSVYAQYRYDAAGMRVLKVVRRSAGPDLVTVSVGGFERILRGAVGASMVAHDEVHLTDAGTRLAIVRRGPVLPDDPLQHPVLYELGDRLSSVTATLAPDGSVLNREEFMPYGETSFGSYARKRFRFQSKERDEQSSLAHHGARAYAPWLGRWTSPDPLGLHDGPNPYAFVRGDPVNGTDPGGFQSVFGEGERYQALATQPGHTREHFIPGSWLQYGFEETYGKQSSEALASRTYNNAYAVILSNVFAGPKTKLDLAHAAELRADLAAGRSVNLRDAYLRSVQNVQAGGQFSPADRAKMPQIAAKELVSWVKAEGVARDAASGTPIPKVLSKRLSAGTPPATAPASAQKVAVTTFPKKDTSPGPSLGGGAPTGSVETGFRNTGFRFNPAAEAGELGRMVPFVVEAEASLLSASFLVLGSKLTAPLAAPLGAAARALPVAAGVGVIGAASGHAARYGAEKAGASPATAHGIGLATAALTGAAIGSMIIPGVGTLAGGLIGGAAATILYLWTSG